MDFYKSYVSEFSKYIFKIKPLVVNKQDNTSISKHSLLLHIYSALKMLVSSFKCFSRTLFLSKYTISGWNKL